MQKHSLLLAALLAGALLASGPRAALAQDTFTLAVVPDTQQEVLDAKDTRLKDRFQWLVDNRARLNLKMMLQSGDFVNWDTPDHFQYERASDALTVLDKAKLPYSLAVGNHDTAATKVGGSAAPGNVNTNLRNTSTFNIYFGVGRHKGLEGTHPPGKVDNAFQRFTAGGLNWLVINLELWARTPAVEWAKKVVETHPDDNVIIVTHSHLTSGSTIEQRNGGYGDNSPQYVFDNLIKPYPNVRLVFSGHVGTHGYRTAKGAKGNTIYQFLGTYHSNVDNPVRLVEIDTQKGGRSKHACTAPVHGERPRRRLHIHRVGHSVGACAGWNCGGTREVRTGSPTLFPRNYGGGTTAR
jgi:3',5'-cyclic AMP phosphodiesterase CpdA